MTASSIRALKAYPPVSIPMLRNRRQRRWSNSQKGRIADMAAPIPQGAGGRPARSCPVVPSVDKGTVCYPLPQTAQPRRLHLSGVPPRGP
jgi:hypothetical protein